jgi:hypothetical protein
MRQPERRIEFRVCEQQNKTLFERRVVTNVSRKYASRDLLTTYRDGRRIQASA